jgi:hypothetical protein
MFQYDKGMGRTRRAAAALLMGLVATACPGAKVPGDPGATCRDGKCVAADDLIAAASSFGNVAHDFVIDPTGAMAPGRGLERVQVGSAASWSPVPIACAEPASANATPNSAGATADATIDYAFVGVSVDSTVVGADADLTPYVSIGAEGSVHTVRVMALAFVRERDPQFFKASRDVIADAGACRCGRASHFVGAVKYGGILSYEAKVRRGEAHGSALSFIKAKIASNDADVRRVVIGGLEVSGLRELASGGVDARSHFVVRNPVPIAFAAYPLADVCRLQFPAPEVTPQRVDFGVVPTGKTGTRLIHVENHSSIDALAYYGEQAFSLPGGGSVDIPLVWAPRADTPICEVQTREETLQFVPAHSDVQVTPRQHSVRVAEQIMTGSAGTTRRERIDTGSARKPDYAATQRSVACPPGYVASACKTARAECGDGAGCTRDGYAISVEQSETSCRFRCQGPTSMLTASNYCRFDAEVECVLRCPSAPPTP